MGIISDKAKKAGLFLESTAIRAILPLTVIYMGWLSLQIIETDRTQEAVLGDIRSIKGDITHINADIKALSMQIKVLPTQLNISDRWTGTMQGLWGESVITRLEALEEGQRYFLRRDFRN